MKVILKQDVPKLGSLGDEVNVKPGYARNYLLPKGMALVITSANAKELAFRRKLIEKQRLEKIEQSKSLAEKIKALELKFVMKAGEKGKLFGSITGKHIQDELAKQGIVLEKGALISESHIKQLGSHTLTVKLHSTVQCGLKILVESEETKVSEEEETQA